MAHVTMYRRTKTRRCRGNRMDIHSATNELSLMTALFVQSRGSGGFRIGRGVVIFSGQSVAVCTLDPDVRTRGTARCVNKKKDGLRCLHHDRTCYRSRHLNQRTQEDIETKIKAKG
ncbi:unnamed protein product [Ixodes persulcatus]